MREVKYKEETKTIRVMDEITIKCDMCGEESPEYDGETNEIWLLVDPNRCVSTRVSRDVCVTCYDKIEPHLDALMKLFKAEWHTSSTADDED